NAHVFTADAQKPEARAVAVRGKQIVYVGDEQGVKDWKGSRTRVVDGARRTLMPGIIDSHFHMQHGSLELDKIHFEPCFTYEQAVEAIQTYASQNPEASWLTGFGMRYNLGPDLVPMKRQYLDAVIADRPIAITAYDGHTMWVNTLGLRMAGIFNGAECPPNSYVVLDEHGEATGELKERANQFIAAVVPEPDRSTRLRLLKRGINIASQMGITSVHNMDGEVEQAELYAAIEQEGELNVRIYLPLSIRVETTLDEIREQAVTLKTNYHTEHLRGGCVKMFMDGVIETYTGLLVDPYADDPSTHGDSNYSVEHFNRNVLEADRLDMQIFVHSVGYGGVRRVLNAYALARQTNGVRDARHRVEHIEVIHPDDLPRFQQLDVIASMQPLHAPPSTDVGDVWLERVGKKRWPLSFAWTDIRKAGARLVFGSDWPVVTQNPILGIHNTLNRKPWAEGMPHHHQDLADTLLSYTREAAYAEFQEQVKGQLKVGYLADMLLLSEDIFTIPPESMKDVHPHMTMMGGKITYEME
ncbi:MAG TPA: amidohydrolase, partial [Anaerolineales bacterium]|nr:amidohydrolase [Anaerolineales bacterium]